MPEVVRSIDGLCVRGFKRSYRHRATDSHRFTKRFDALDLVHGLRGEVRLAAARARPHGDAFNDQERCSLAETARDVLQLRRASTAMRALPLSRGR
jgi:hypothetical protein